MLKERRKKTRAEISFLFGLLLQAMVLLGMMWWIPGGSYLVMIPLFFHCLSIIIMTLVKKEGATYILLVPIFFVNLLFVPFIYILIMAFSIGALPFVFLLVMWLKIMVFPLIKHFLNRNDS